MTQYELNLRDYWRVLKKRKQVVIITTIAVTLFTTIFTLKNRPVAIYQSTASVKVEENNTFTGLYMEMISWDTGDSLETQASIITSFPIAEKVAKKIGLIEHSITSDEIRNSKAYLSIVLDLKENLSTEREGNTSIINIIAASLNPEQAQKIANTTAEVYRDENIAEQNKRILEAKKFIENQLNIIGKKLHDAEEKMLSYKKKTGLVAIDAHIRRNFDKLAGAEDNFEKVSAKLKDIEIISSQLEEKKTLPSDILKSLSQNTISSSFFKLSNRLAELNMKRDLLLFDLTDIHPEIIEIDAEIDEIAKHIIKELKTVEINLKRKKNALKNKVNGLNRQYVSMPQDELTLARLERAVKVNENIYSQLESKYQEVLIKEAEKIENVTIVRPALEPEFPVNSSEASKNIYIGTVLGLILGLVFAFIYETMDTSIGSIEEVENLLGIPVIGLIPEVKKDEIKETIDKKVSSQTSPDALEKNAHLIFHFTPMSPFSESYKTLRSNLQFVTLEKNLKVMLFTSSSPKEGKTICSMNTAISLAQSGKKVVLIDADLRKPDIHKTFGLDRAPGLSDILLGHSEWKKIVRDTMDIIVGNIEMENIIFVPGIDNLHIITSGDSPMNPAELILSNNMTNFIDELKNSYDSVIFDCSPALFSSDSLTLGKKVDGVFLVYKTGEVARGALSRTKNQLENVGAKVFGVILNGTKADIIPDSYELTYGQYEYEYGYGEEESKKLKKAGWRLSRVFIKNIISKILKKTDKKKKRTHAKKISGLGKTFALILAILFLCIGFLYAK